MGRWDIAAGGPSRALKSQNFIAGAISLPCGATLVHHSNGLSRRNNLRQLPSKNCYSQPGGRSEICAEVKQSDGLMRFRSQLEIGPVDFAAVLSTRS